MKKFLIIFSLYVLMLLPGCATADPEDEQVQGGPNFTGDGGKEISLTILAPRSNGLEANQAYLPTLVQGEFVSNFSGFSAISVLDRVRLDDQYAELLSGYYSDDAKAGMDLGHLTPTTHIMSGSITKTATGYALQMQITNNADKMTTASYSGTFNYAELDNLSGIRRASLDLLQKMGVTLTAKAQAELSGAAAINHVKAQTALAQGITAQKSGNEFEAMFNYFEARTFDVNLPEASARMTSASATLVSNNWQNSGLRDQVLSEIERMKEEARQEAERRKNIDALLKQAAAFYREHQPFEINTPESFRYGNVNHKRGTVDIAVYMSLTPIAEEFKIIQQLANQAKSTGDARWPFNKRKIDGYDISAWVFSFGLFELYDLLFTSPPSGPRRDGIWKYSSFNNNSEPKFSVTAIIFNEQGKQINRLSFKFSEIFTGNKREDTTINPESGTFSKTFTIDAQDFTDTMTMQIVSINGKSVQSGYVRVPEPVKVLSAQEY